jgi:predicted RNA-binding Zn-ribbon protein involved in translation (DUF1610 family)
MTSCTHRQLVLLRATHHRLRCRHCHLTINANDLTSRYCPECFETSKTKRYDFEEIVTPDSGIVRYRCEECGVMIECR